MGTKKEEAYVQTKKEKQVTINAEVRPYPHESTEALIKRFNKKCKKEDLLREFYATTEFKSKKQKRKEKSLRHRRMIKRKQQKRARKLGKS